MITSPSPSTRRIWSRHLGVGGEAFTVHNPKVISQRSSNFRVFRRCVQHTKGRTGCLGIGRYSMKLFGDRVFGRARGFREPFYRRNKPGVKAPLACKLLEDFEPIPSRTPPPGTREPSAPRPPSTRPHPPGPRFSRTPCREREIRLGHQQFPARLEASPDFGQ